MDTRRQQQKRSRRARCRLEEGSFLRNRKWGGRSSCGWLSETAEKRKGGYGSSMEGGRDAEFASRRDGRPFLSFPLARSIDGRNSDQVADGADRYRRFSSSPRLAASLVRIAEGCGTNEDSKGRADERRWRSRMEGGRWYECERLCSKFRVNPWN